MGYRYIGSKEKLAKIIITNIAERCPDANSVIDLMAGTGLFSLCLRQSGYRVLASDIMTYSYHHLRVNLELNEAPLFTGLSDIFAQKKYTYSDVIEYLNNLEPVCGYFTKEFSPGGGSQCRLQTENVLYN